MRDPHRLQRFVDAQAQTFAQAWAELRAGRKTSHWMWFVFPQLLGLGHSAMAQRFGIASLDEARAYLEHPLLGSRLSGCTRLVLDAERPPADIFGSPDDLKFRSCMTLFDRAADGGTVFGQALRLCGDGPDPATLALLAALPRP
ncbi:MAG: DUF1810 domain-containing protein [Luteimonas sp.]